MEQQLPSSPLVLFHSDLDGHLFYMSFTADGLAIGMGRGGVGQHNGAYHKKCDRTAARSYMDGWGNGLLGVRSRGEGNYEV